MRVKNWSFSLAACKSLVTLKRSILKQWGVHWHMIGICSREHIKRRTGSCSFDDYLYKEKQRNGMEARQAGVVREGDVTHGRNNNTLTCWWRNSFEKEKQWLRQVEKKIPAMISGRPKRRVTWKKTECTDFEAGSWLIGWQKQYLAEVVFYCFCMLSEIRSKVISAIREDERVVLKVWGEGEFLGE